MKIGIDLRSLGEGSLHRGIGTYVYNLLWSLAEVDSQNIYYLFADTHQADYFLKTLPHTANFNFIFIKPPRFRKKKFIRTFVIKNYTLDVTKYSLDVVYQLDVTFPLKTNNIPVVTIVYDLIPFIYKDQYMQLKLHHKTPVGLIILMKDYRRFKLINKSLKSHKDAARVITISEHTKKDLIKIVGVEPKKAVPILLGADKKERDNHAINNVTKKSNYTKKPFFLYVGGADPRKGLLSFLDDFSNLLNSGQDVNLIIAGKEITDTKVPESVKIRDKILSLGIEEHVITPGFVSDQDLDMLYSNAIGFIFPSRYEGFGLPVLEAMEARCPVITYKNSSIPEVAGNAAILVDDGEPLVNAMEQLIKDGNLRKKLIDAGVSQAKKFTWNKTAQETLAVFESVAHEHTV